MGLYDNQVMGLLTGLYNMTNKFFLNRPTDHNSLFFCALNCVVLALCRIPYYKYKKIMKCNYPRASQIKNSINNIVDRKQIYNLTNKS
jgi:hypothetical protein